MSALDHVAYLVRKDKSLNLLQIWNTGLLAGGWAVAGKVDRKQYTPGAIPPHSRGSDPSFSKLA